MGEEISEELHAWLRVRKVSDLGETAIPILDQQANQDDLTAPTVRVDAIQTLVEEAIGQLGEGPYKAAASRLFKRSAQFASMKEKGTAAAGEFGVSYDAFRRRPGTGLSRLDETVNAVAGVIALGVEAKSDHVFEPARPPEVTSFLVRRRMWPVLVGVAVLVVGIGVSWLVRGGGEPLEDPVGAQGTSEEPVSAADEVAESAVRPAESEPPNLLVEPAEVADVPAAFLDAAPCSFAVGQASAELAMTAARQARFVAVFEANGGEDVLGCAVEQVTDRGGLLWQEVRRNNIAAGGLLEVSAEQVLYLNAGQWRSYIRIGGGDGTRSPILGGIPTGDVGETIDGWSFSLDGGVEMFAESEDGNYYWLPLVVVRAWNDAGRSEGFQGRPTGSPRLTEEGMRQDFENGYLILRGNGDLDWVEVFDPGAVLPPAENMKGQIIGAADGTAWVIDDQLRRWWIVDGTHFYCAGGERNVLADELPGYAIHTLEYGGRFPCPGSELDLEPDGGNLVFQEFCESEIAAGAGVEVDEDGDWRCVSGDDWVPISLDAACRWQYGEDAVGRKDETDPTIWTCENP